MPKLQTKPLTKVTGLKHAPQELLIRHAHNRAPAILSGVYQSNGDRLIRRNKVLGYDLVRVKDNVKQAMARYENMEAIAYTEPNHHYTTSFIPNDQYFSLQYGLNTIEAPMAWNTTQGKSGTIVAVIDTGVQTDHPDLCAKLLKGYNFVSNNRNTNDDNGHGTHVSGIAAAITNNHIGVAGTSPRCRILPIKAGNAKGQLTIEAIVRGLVYAVSRGAKVVNMSFGGPDYSRILEEACAYAFNHGVSLIAAAGNDDSNQPHYPAYFSTVVAVAATDRNDKKADFSNYGPWVDVAAPGVKIASTYIHSSYVYLSGTSMSCPFVAGLATLLASQGRNNVQIRKVILQSANKITGTGKYWRYGRINARRAVIANCGSNKTSTTKILVARHARIKTKAKRVG